jgi:hypothetical protein
MVQDYTINTELCLASRSPAVSNNFILMLQANSAARFMEKLVGTILFFIIQKTWSIGNFGTPKTYSVFNFVFNRIALHAWIVLINIKLIALYEYTLHVCFG